MAARNDKAVDFRRNMHILIHPLLQPADIGWLLLVGAQFSRCSQVAATVKEMLLDFLAFQTQVVQDRIVAHLRYDIA